MPHLIAVVPSLLLLFVAWFLLVTEVIVFTRKDSSPSKKEHPAPSMPRCRRRCETCLHTYRRATQKRRAIGAARRIS